MSAVFGDQAALHVSHRDSLKKLYIFLRMGQPDARVEYFLATVKRNTRVDWLEFEYFAYFLNSSRYEEVVRARKAIGVDSLACRQCVEDGMQYSLERVRHTILFGSTQPLLLASWVEVWERKLRIPKRRRLFVSTV